jgi:hypothetical protein
MRKDIAGTGRHIYMANRFSPMSSLDIPPEGVPQSLVPPIAREESSLRKRFSKCINLQEWDRERNMP